VGGEDGNVFVFAKVLKKAYIAACSFNQRRFAMMDGLLTAAALSVALFAVMDSAVDRHETFTALLAEHVKEGHVDYKGLQKDARLDAYLQQLQETNPDTIGDDKDRLAFWLNVYNAFTLKLIVDNYPIKSINELHFGGLYIGTLLKKTVWHKVFIEINGKALSLNNIEHDIIRKNFREPRIHFALVCASVSCPPLRSEAFEGYKLDAQLHDQAVRFFSDLTKNHFDLEDKVAYLSPILDWYERDFGGDDVAVLRFVATFLPAPLAQAILAEPEAWNVKHTKYDWGLNE